MNDELRKEAKKKVEAKKAFYTVATVFAGTAVILILLMFIIPEIAFWLMLAFPALALVLGVLYISAFGYPGTDSDAADWEEAEIQKEMAKIQRRQDASEAVTDPEPMELKDLEQVEQRMPNEEDFV